MFTSVNYACGHKGAADVAPNSSPERVKAKAAVRPCPFCYEGELIHRTPHMPTCPACGVKGHRSQECPSY